MSEGTPSESGLRLDAQAALDFIANHPDLSKVPIVRPSRLGAKYLPTCLH